MKNIFVEFDFRTCYFKKNFVKLYYNKPNDKHNTGKYIKLIQCDEKLKPTDKTFDILREEFLISYKEVLLCNDNYYNRHGFYDHDWEINLNLFFPLFKDWISYPPILENKPEFRKFSGLKKLDGFEFFKTSIEKDLKNPTTKFTKLIINNPKNRKMTAEKFIWNNEFKISIGVKGCRKCGCNLSDVRYDKRKLPTKMFYLSCEEMFKENLIKNIIQ